MKLTQDQVSEAMKKLEAKGVVCSVCRKGHFGIDRQVYTLVPLVQNADQPEIETTPIYLVVTCQNCTNVMLFSLKDLGIISDVRVRI